MTAPKIPATAADLISTPSPALPGEGYTLFSGDGTPITTRESLASAQGANVHEIEVAAGAFKRPLYIKEVASWNPNGFPASHRREKIPF